MAQGVGETVQPPVEETAAFLQIVFTFRRHGQRLGVFGHIGFRQEIAVELLIVSGSLDPDVAGSQPAAQNGERRDFIVAAINAALFDKRRCQAFGRNDSGGFSGIALCGSSFSRFNSSIAESSACLSEEARNVKLSRNFGANRRTVM